MNVKSLKQKKGGSLATKKTLDIQHGQNIARFSTIKSEIQYLSQELEKIETKIKMTSNVNELNESLFNNYIDTVDRKIEIETRLKKLKSECDETQYYINTADILYKYYNLVEKGKDTSLIDMELSNPSKCNNTILKYFVQPQSHSSNQSIDDVSEENEQSRGTLLEKYLMYTDDNFICKKTTDLQECCEFCSSSNITVMTHDGYAFCNNCHTMEYLIIDHDKPSYKDPPKEISYFAYKRINHFQEFSGLVRVLATCLFLMNPWNSIYIKIEMYF